MAAVHDGDSNAYSANQAYHMLSQEVYAFTDSKMPDVQRDVLSSHRKLPLPLAVTAPALLRTPRLLVTAPARVLQLDAMALAPLRALRAGRYGSASAQGGRTDFIRRQLHSGGTLCFLPKYSASPFFPGESLFAKQQAKLFSKQAAHPTETPDHYSIRFIKASSPCSLYHSPVFVIRLFKPGEDTKDTTAATTPPVEYMTESTSADAVPDTTAADNAAPVYKTTDTLNVRSQPNTDGERIGQLAAGTTVEYIRAHDAEWAVILYNGQEAYVASQYLSAE